MDNTSTDTQSERAKADSIDYWLLIDAVDAELSGIPMKYKNSEQVSAALGVDEQMTRCTLFRLRGQLTTRRDRMR